VDVVAWARQFPLLTEVVVIEFIHSASISSHSLAHGVVSASLAKCRVLLVGYGRRAGDFLDSFVIQAVDVKFLHVIAA
jgi:hypothetical protein